MTRILTALCLLVFAACGEDPKVAEPGPLKAGVSFRPFNLPVGHPHAGYAQVGGVIGESHPPDDPGSPWADIFPATRGVETPTGARVLVLDNGHHRMALVRLDLVFSTWALTERIHQLAGKRLGDEMRDALLIHATHTHAGPGRLIRKSMSISEEGYYTNAISLGTDSFLQESVDRMAHAVVDALEEAIKNLKPAAFGHGVVENLSANSDRRCQNDALDGGPDKDTRITVLRVEDLEKKRPMAVLFHFPMHGTVSGGTNRLLSGDVSFHAEIALERSFDEPVFAMYLQGAAGDVAPRTHGQSGTHGMSRVGWDLAQSVLEVLPTIKLEREVVLQSVERWVPITYELLGYERREFPSDGAILCQALYTNDDCTGGPILPQDVFCPMNAQEGGNSYATIVAAARIGDLALATLPGEPMTAVGRALEKKALEENAWAKRALVLGYAMDHHGYLLFDEDWLSGGYEPTITLWGWKFARYVTDKSAETLKGLSSFTEWSKDKIDIPDLAPLEWTPIAASGADRAPVIETDMPESIERLGEVEVSFYGYDPTLGTPVVSLESEEGGAWKPVLEKGWRAVSTETGGAFPLRYEASPTWKEDKTASVRTHKWMLRFTPGVDLPTGSYRLHIELKDAEKKSVSLHTRTFEVKPSTALGFQAAFKQVDGALVFHLVPNYPVQAPVWATSERNARWQVGGFHPVTPRYKAPFAPVVGGEIAASGVVDGAGESLVFEPFEAEVSRESSSYAPGEGPGYTLTFEGASSVAITLEAGAFTDAYGNSSAAASFNSLPE